MKNRLGIRKVATFLFNSKIGKATDKTLNFVHRLPGIVVNKIDKKTGAVTAVKKLKVDVSGKKYRKNANSKINAMIEATERNLTEQEAKDIIAAKEFEREKEENCFKLMTEDSKIEDVVMRVSKQRDTSSMSVKVKLSDTIKLLES